MTSRRTASCRVEPLESRQLFAAVAPNDLEQYMLELLNRARANPAAEAARHGIDLVFTYVYAHPDDEPDVRALVEPVLVNGGAVHFVQLTCARDKLLVRVAHESRRAYRKLSDPAAVSEMLDRRNDTAAVPFADSLRIDTSDMTPAEAARQIVTHYALPTVTRREEGGESGAPA